MANDLKNDLKILEEDYFGKHYESPIFHEYLAFSKFWQDAIITSDYIIDTGNFSTCNLEMIHRFYEQTKRHPILWRIFRFIFGV